MPTVQARVVFEVESQAAVVLPLCRVRGEKLDGALVPLALHHVGQFTCNHHPDNCVAGGREVAWPFGLLIEAGSENRRVEVEQGEAATPALVKNRGEWRAGDVYELGHDEVEVGRESVRNESVAEAVADVVHTCPGRGTNCQV